MLKIMEKMNNKTCGECKYFKSTDCSSVCTWYCCENSEEETCCNFELPKKLTNGDRIRSMSDEELAMLMIDDCCSHCNYGVDKFGNCNTKMSCDEAILEWLKKEVNNE